MKKPRLRKILIVDDSRTVQADLSAIFEASGFEVTLCASVPDARDALETGAFDLMLLDVQLPDADGVEFLEELKASSGGKTPPVILLSTEDEVQNRIRGLSAGASDFVGKPYDPAYLLSRAQELIHRAHSGDAAAAGPRVLVIDDSRSVRESLRLELESVGYEVTTAATGEEGLLLAASEFFSAAIVDSGLPGIDGTTVIRRLRSNPTTRSIPCIMLTAADSTRMEVGALEAGADSYIHKKEDLSIVLLRLAALIDGKTRVQPVTQGLLGTKRLLIFSNQADDRDPLLRALQGEQYEVTAATNEKELFDFLTIQPVDAVILIGYREDVKRTQDVCRRIKSSPSSSQTPVVAICPAGASSSQSAAFLGAGADEILMENADVELLRARLAAQIRRSQYAREDQAARDQKHRLELADTRALLLEKLERANWELECFNSSVSHDLKAPTRSILGFARILEEDHAATLDQDGRDALTRIRSSAERMSQLIEDLMKLAKLNSQELRRGSVDLSVAAEDVCAQLRETNLERQVKFVIEKNLRADGDARLLRIVLENLLGNAWKYSAKNTAAVIELGAFPPDRPEEGPVFFVRDNGVGFDMAHASRLFGVFQRLHTEAEYTGTGIGLVTVQRIIQRHGGRVWAEAKPGEGALFRFTTGKASV